MAPRETSHHCQTRFLEDDQAMPFPHSQRSGPTESGTVVLLHGLALARWAMARVEAACRRAGYRTLNLSYASRTQPFESLCGTWLPGQLRAAGIDASDAGAPLHLITQSMGGLLVRGWLRERGVPPALRRVVMFAPPNQGTVLVDQLGGAWWFRRTLGVNAPRLGTGPGAIAPQLGPWPDPVDLGIIAGDRPMVARAVRWTKEPNDGKVTVAGTRLAGMRDHLVLPYSHTWLQYHRDAIAQALAFLREGRFRR